MELVCLDMESTLTPEMWVEYARASGIDELKKTTRDEPDYDKLMHMRIDLLRERGIKLADIIALFDQLDPLPGAREFLDELRDFAQVIIISDTFLEFALPLIAKLGRPTIFANELLVDADGIIVGYKMRCKRSKYDTVRGLQSIGFDTIAVGDSYNDVDMIRASKTGFLINASKQIEAECSDIRAVKSYDELIVAIRDAMS